MPELVIQVSFGEPTTGLWCPQCLKPSGYDVPVYWLRDSGISFLARLRKCDDCNMPLPDEGN